MSRSAISTFELFAMFPDAESARAYMEAKRWPGGATCPACGEGKRVKARPNGLYRCNACIERGASTDFSVRTGTIFEKSKIPLHKWLYAMDLLVTAQKGLSSLQLAKQIDVTQKSAWFMLVRLREACGDDPKKVYQPRLSQAPAARDAITEHVLSYRPAAKGQAVEKAQEKLPGKPRKKKNQNSSI